ncbi:fused (3R)-hydroxyacyl-ACP dehydratase subunits HadA/HadB [Nocardia terpenica]|uniref:(R)-hydratase n=1 Tax=Nocardia terpenica TaxID=455432 RepID=A0A6G9Z9L9_9NOCA|nr:fused (3R)-hydroxyacyl-ACP dehydratase subunits HadA/HadB [Nocardia terpenica]QIS22057.1 (R)-hydratase [Nocardia terpenica]
MSTRRWFRLPDHYEVGREKIREFARAVQNDHPVHRDDEQARKLGYLGVVAPPTFTAILTVNGIRAVLNTVLPDRDLSQVLHAEQTFEMHRAVVAGDRLRCAVQIASIRSPADTDFVTLRFVVTDQSGYLVRVESTTLAIRRGELVRPDIARLVETVAMRDDGDRTPFLVPITAAAELPTSTSGPYRGPDVDTLPRADRLAVGHALPPRTARLTRGDLVNYAGVSGDPNPIHFSDAAAEFAGLPTVVAHGMLTMGVTAGYLTSWLGDPTAIRTFGVRFSRPAEVPARAATELELTGRIRAIGPDTATVALDARAAGEQLFSRAFAEVQLSATISE